jgi:hypothetical protein
VCFRGATQRPYGSYPGVLQCVMHDPGPAGEFVAGFSVKIL